MDISVVIMGVVFLALIIAPFVWASIKRKGKYKNEIEGIKKLAQLQQVKPENIEVINNLILGLDESTGKMVWSTMDNLEKNFEVIDLKEYKTCLVKNALGDKGYRQVALELNGKNKNKVFELFRAEEGVWPEKDAQKCREEAEKWIKRIDPFLQAS